MFLFGARKTVALHYFLTPKNRIFEAVWKQMSGYLCIPQTRGQILSGRVEWGGGGGGG